jgi:hypothetical protein
LANNIASVTFKASSSARGDVLLVALSSAADGVTFLAFIDSLFDNPNNCNAFAAAVWSINSALFPLSSPRELSPSTDLASEDFDDFSPSFVVSE